MARTRANTSRRATRRPARQPATIDWRSRVREPTISDPEQRRKAIDRAGSLIKTTARIDTISLGRD